MRCALLIVGVLGACAPTELSSSKPPQPRSLEGRWSVELSINSANALGPVPTKRVVRGEIAVSAERSPTIFAAFPGDTTQRFGRYSIDLTPFFGGPIARDVSTTTMGPVDTAFTTELLARRLAADSVEFDFIPRISHGGLSLTGRLNGDSIVGSWIQRAYGGGASGNFVMQRLSATPVAVALPPLPPQPEPVDSTQLGSLRVRIFDDASRRYFVTRFGLRMQDRSTLYANMRTGNGPEGWGPVVMREPGTYGVVVKRFQCGDKFWALADDIERPVELSRGDTTYLSIEVTVPELNITPTYDNRSGAACLVAPGDEP